MVSPLKMSCGLGTIIFLLIVQIKSSFAVTMYSFLTQTGDVSPYIDLILCPARNEPLFDCARQQSARVLNLWSDQLDAQWQILKVEADNQLNATLGSRGYSASELLVKEKPSTLLKKIEIGTTYMKRYFAEAMDGFLGREYDYEQEFDELDDSDDEEEAQEETLEEENIDSEDDSEDEIEFFNDDQELDAEELERKKNQKKKKGQKGQHGSVAAQPTVIFVQASDHAEAGHNGNDYSEHNSGNDGLGAKRKKRKKRPQNSVVQVQHEDDHSDSFGLGILDELTNIADKPITVNSGKHKRKNKRPTKYGRSIGVMRGKKKKKRRAIMKIIMLATFLKNKIELLLKLLGAHLQIKFLGIAFIGLLVNIARFWIDVKRGAPAQKVVYVEHAHHQHHYDEHADEWGAEGGGYWKRSLQTDSAADETLDDGFTDGYGLRPEIHYPQPDPHYLAYRNQVH